MLKRYFLYENKKNMNPEVRTFPATEVAERIIQNLKTTNSYTKRLLYNPLMLDINQNVSNYFSEKRNFYDHICPVLCCFDESYKYRDSKIHNVNLTLLALGLIFSNVILSINKLGEHNEITILKLYHFMNQVIQTALGSKGLLNRFAFKFVDFMRDHNPEIDQSLFPQFFLDICSNVQILNVRSQPRPQSQTQPRPQSLPLPQPQSQPQLVQSTEVAKSDKRHLSKSSRRLVELFELDHNLKNEISDLEVKYEENLRKIRKITGI